MQAAAALHNSYSAPEATPQDVAWMNAASAGLLVLAVLLLIGAGVHKLTRMHYFDLKRVQLEGDLHRNNLATVRANIVPRMHGGFFTANLQYSREVFESVPWVRKAMVRRVWPNELRVTLEEHVPAAYWHHEDRDDQLVNLQGEVFDANLGDVEDDHLPTLSAPINPKPEDARLMLDMLHKLQPVLASLGEIDTLKLTERGSWSVELDNEARIELGRGTIDEVLARTDRFVRTYPELKRDYAAPLAYADLRYPDGYAVRLRGTNTFQDSAKLPVKKPAVSKPASSASAHQASSSATSSTR
jgi:cell division protein FtsQ